MKLYLILCAGCMVLFCSCTRKVEENPKELETGPEVTMCKG
jgi:hypothetical protein